MSEERLSLVQLAQRQAQGNYYVGDYYRHNKHGDIYEITSASVRESDGEIILHYEQIVGPIADSRLDITFDRPLDEFVEPRFTQVEQKVIYE